MDTERIKEIQSKTAYPESVSVQQALLQVWNECEQEQLRIGAVVGRSEQLTAFAEYCENEHGLFIPSWMIDGYNVPQLCEGRV